jgi:hypothetical protein
VLQAQLELKATKVISVLRARLELQVLRVKGDKGDVGATGAATGDRAIKVM